MKEFSIGSNEAGQRFDKYLHKLLPEAGNGFIYKMLRKKNITLNGAKAEGREQLRPGDVVKVFFSDETFDKFAGKASGGNESPLAAECRRCFLRYPLVSGKNGDTSPSIVLETGDVLILNKPVGMLSQKAKPEDSSLNEWLIGYLLSSGQLSERELDTFHPSVCNRLDRNTGGLVLCGKSLAGSRLLSRLLKEERIGKFYRCIVKGAFTASKTYQGYLSKNTSTNMVTVSDRPRPGADFIRTSYEPLQVYGRGESALTYLEIRLHTGKTHQIRAHLSSIGYPVLGDPKYGDLSFNKRWFTKANVRSQLLYACRLEFPPLDGADEMTTGTVETLSGKKVAAPEPELFAAVLGKA